MSRRKAGGTTNHARQRRGEKHPGGENGQPSRPPVRLQPTAVSVVSVRFLYKQKCDSRTMEASAVVTLADAAQSAVPRITAAAEECDACIARLIDNIAVAGSHVVTAVEAMLLALESARTVFTSTAISRRNRAIKACNAHLEELDGIISGCDAAARLLCTPNSLYLGTVAPSHANILPRYSTALFAVSSFDVASSVTSASRVQGCIDPALSALAAPDVFTSGTVSPITILCVDDVGSPVSSVKYPDVIVTLLPTAGQTSTAGWTIQGIQCDADGIVTVNIHVHVEFVSDVVCCVVIGGCALPTTVFHGGCSNNGVFVSSYTVGEAGNRGIALSDDGMLMAVSNYHSNTICLYSVCDGKLLRSIGGPGKEPLQFRNIQKLVFSPMSGHLLAADSSNERVQEVSVDGEFVRSIVFRGHPFGLAVNTELLAVGLFSPFHQIELLHLASGTLLRSFARNGLAEGQVKFGIGLRFTQDGAHILVAENQSCRLSLFAVTGELIRCFGTSLNKPHDLELCPNGDIVVVDTHNHRVCVFSPEGSTLIRSYGTEGTSIGEFEYPIALAWRGDTLFVLDYFSPRVQAFR